jgi:hypothetical protein
MDFALIGDGVDFPKLERQPTQVIADKLLKELAKADDDATVVIVKS